MAKFISQGAHGFDDGEIVSVFGVKMDAPGGGTFFNPYNGVFDITKTSPTEFTYLMASAPSSNALTSPAPMCAKQVGTALTRNGTTATFRTVRPHFLERGQIVSMEGALVGGSAINPFNGKNFAITSVGLTSFTYEMSGVPTTHAYGSASYRGKDIEGLLHIENNVFELFANPDPIGLPVGAVSMGGGGLVFPPNYVFRQVAIRGNLVRHEDTAQDMANKTTAFGFFNAGAVLIEDNVIALSGTTPILFDVSAMTSCANNLTPQGTLIPAYDLATGRFTEAYFPAAEEAMVLAML
jgi:hypothetical protein